MILDFFFHRPSTSTHLPTLRLIDFGCAIDMKMFEPRTQFKKVSYTVLVIYRYFVIFA